MCPNCTWIVIFLPLDLYPFVGIIISSGIKAITTAKICHKPYFDAKKMTPHEVAVFVTERKTGYLGELPNLHLYFYTERLI